MATGTLYDWDGMVALVGVIISDTGRGRGDRIGSEWYFMASRITGKPEDEIKKAIRERRKERGSFRVLSGSIL